MTRETFVRCPRCGGTGDAWDDEAETGRLTCLRCAGSGTVRALIVEEVEK